MAEKDKAAKGAAGNPNEETQEKASTALTKAGKQLLEANPSATVIYMTTDGRGFFNKSDAVNHGRTLKTKTVIEVKK